MWFMDRFMDRFKSNNARQRSSTEAEQGFSPVKLGSYIAGGLLAASAAWSSFFTVGETERGLL